MDDSPSFGCMPSWPVADDSEPGIVVPALSCTAAAGRPVSDLTVTLVRVPPDFADDLAHQAQAFAYPAAGDHRLGVTAWHVGAIGFTEADAIDALDIVLATLAEKAA